MKKNYKKIIRMNNAIDPATSTARSFGFGPVSGKGGKTTNYDEAKKDTDIRREIKKGVK